MKPQHHIGQPGEPPRSWRQTTLSPEQIVAWRNSFEGIYGEDGPGCADWPDRAETLALYGWTPEFFREQVETHGAGLSQPFLQAAPHNSSDSQAMATSEVEAAGALTREVVLAHEALNSRPTYLRNVYVQALSEAGWSFREIGEHMGITKQRAQQISKSVKAGQLPSPPLRWAPPGTGLPVKAQGPHVGQDLSSGGPSLTLGTASSTDANGDTKTIDGLLAYVQELRNHALELLPLDDDDALVQEHPSYLHWLNHNAYARFVTFEDNERLQLSTGVLAGETLDELNQLNDNASLHAAALGYRMRTPQRAQLRFFRENEQRSLQSLSQPHPNRCW